MNYLNKIEPKLLPKFTLKDLLDRWGSLEVNNIFLAYFKKIPSRYTFGDLDMGKFHQDFSKHFQQYICGVHYQKFNLREDWQSDFTYVLENQVIVQKDKDEVNILFCKEQNFLVKEILQFTNKYRKRKELILI